MICQLGIGFRKKLVKYMAALDEHRRVIRLLRLGRLVISLCILHDQAEQGESVVLDEVRVAHVEQQILVLGAVIHTGLLRIHGIPLDDPQYGGKHLVHALSIAHVGIQLAEYEQDIEQHLLGVGLAEVGVVGHAAVDILEDFGAQGFIFAQSNPRGLSQLSQRSDLCLLCATPAVRRVCTYFIAFAERVEGGFELIGVLDGTQEVGAERVVDGARLGKGRGPFLEVDVLEQEECLRVRA